MTTGNTKIIDARARFKHKHYSDTTSLFAVSGKARALAAMGALKGIADANIWSQKKLACAAHHVRALQEMASTMGVGEDL